MTQADGQQTGQQTGQQGQQSTGQQGPPAWYTNPPPWLTSPPATQHSGQSNTPNYSALETELRAMPEKVVRALQDAITAATQQTGQQNTGQQNTGQQNTGQQNTGQQNTGQQNSGQDNEPGRPRTFGERWFAQQ